MIKIKTLKLSTFALFFAALLGACASSGDSPTGTSQEVQEIQTQLLGDMPLPAASKIIGAESLIIGRGDNWVGRVVLSGVQTHSFSADFRKFPQTNPPNSSPISRFTHRNPDHSRTQ